MFGLSFDDAARFQAACPRHHTAQLDAQVYNTRAYIPWFQESQRVRLGADLAPLSQWLSGNAIRRLDSLAKPPVASYRYLKIGSRDVYAFPDLLPGSIVRIDSRFPVEQLFAEEHAERIFAVQHSRGIVCSRLRSAGQDRIVLCSRQLPYAPLEFQLGTEARILGAVDFEIRPLLSVETPEVSASAARVWKPSAIVPHAQSVPIGEWIRGVRIQQGLSFRQASERTREIARRLGNPNYFCAPSALSDVEARGVFPRHIHKLISLSAVYCVPVDDLVALAGLRAEDAGQEAMQERSLKSSGQLRPERLQPSRFLEAVHDKVHEIPFFLRNALPAIVGLPRLSVRDLFWAGATGDFIHPYLKDSTFLAINRQSKTPATSLASPVWAQPLYLLQTRDGKRSCAACSLQNGTLLVRPCTTTSRNLVLRYRNRIDAEVLGRIVALVRRVSPGTGANLQPRKTPP